MSHQITGLFESLNQIDSILPINTPVDDLNPKEWDATEVIKARVYTDKLQAFRERLKAYHAIPHALLDAVPPLIVSRIRKAIELSVTTSHQVASHLKPSQNGTNPRRAQGDYFSREAEKIEESDATIWSELSWMLSANETVHQPDEGLRGTRDTIDELRAETERAIELQQNLREEFARIQEESARQAAVDLATHNISQLVSIIDEHKESKRRWLICLWVASAVTLATMVYVFESAKELSPSAEVAVVISLVFGKLLLVSFALGLCVLCSRNYQTHAHNIVVNSHRRIAWLSFLDLYKAMSSADQSLKEELVRQASQSIFAHTSTGFLNKSTNEFAPFAPILGEMLKKG